MVVVPADPAGHGAVRLALRRNSHATVELAHACALRLEADHLLAGHRAADSCPHSCRRPGRRKRKRTKRPSPRRHPLGVHDPRGTRKVPRVDAQPTRQPGPRTRRLVLTKTSEPILASLYRRKDGLPNPYSYSLIPLTSGSSSPAPLSPPPPTSSPGIPFHNPGRRTGA